MLSDEERKVMDSLKVISEYAGDNYLAKEHRRKLKLLIELVEKQQKEIEELKEVKWYYEISRVPKDKIKAKIEEVSNGTYDAKIVLQSLLEKE